MFGSIVNTYHGATILCCTTTDLGILYVKSRCFGTVLGIFGVTFVKTLVACFAPASKLGALFFTVTHYTTSKESAYRIICMLCQQTSPKRWFASVDMTSYCDLTNSAYQTTVTTIRHSSILEFRRGHTIKQSPQASLDLCTQLLMGLYQRASGGMLPSFTSPAETPMNIFITPIKSKNYYIHYFLSGHDISRGVRHSTDHCWKELTTLLDMTSQQR